MQSVHEALVSRSRAQRVDELALAVGIVRSYRSDAELSTVTRASASLPGRWIVVSIHRSATTQLLKSIIIGTATSKEHLDKNLPGPYAFSTVVSADGWRWQDSLIVVLLGRSPHLLRAVLVIWRQKNRLRSVLRK